MNDSELVSIIKRIAEGIAETFGNNCEVEICDLDHPDSTIIAIYNGHVSGRKIGDSISKLGIKILKENHPYTEDLIGYKSTTQDGKIIKSSSIFIKSGKVNICLGINIDCTYLALAHSTLANLINIDEGVSDELYSLSSNDFLEQVIAEAFELVGKPPTLLNKSDRIRIVEYIDERGALFMQKGVVTIAEKLNVSRYTVYNYLKEIRKTHVPG